MRRLWATLLLLALIQSDKCWGLCLSNISVSEYSALESLFKSGNGSDWTWNTTLPSTTRWTFPSDLSAPCASKWQGINCSYSSGVCVVSSLELPSFNAHGFLPTEISQLMHTTTLNLTNNDFSGPIPSEICGMSSLLYLDLSNNSFVGEIPSQIGQLTSIRSLNLRDNELHGNLPAELGLLSLCQIIDLNSNFFNGTIPDSFSGLHSLWEIYLDDNFFRGSIPTEINLWSQLKVLSLSRNFFSMPISSIWSLSGLKIIDIHSNLFTGSISSHIGQLIDLEYINFSRNLFNGSIPSEIGLLSKLSMFAVGFNRISGTLPSEIGLLSSVECIALNENVITGTLPSELGPLPVLSILLVDRNWFSGQISFIPNQAKLSILDMSFNVFTGSIPTELGYLTGLLSLMMNFNKLTGIIPTEIGQCSLLNYLLFELNRLTGSIPSEIGDLSHMKELNLGFNIHSNSIPSEIGKLVVVEYLFLSVNLLTGPMPSEIGGLHKLLVITLGLNRCHGQLPSEIGQLRSAVYMYLNENRFSGTVPPEIGEMSSLSYLTLSENKFTGPLPSQIGQLTELKFLYLFGNQFSGTLPMELGMLPFLAALALSSNKFTGTLPMEIGSISTCLLSLAVYSNSFTGPLPSAIGQLNQLQNLDISLNSFTSQIPSEIFSMFELENIDFSGNYFEKSLQTFRNLTSMKSIDISMNHFDGTVPQFGGQTKSFNASFNLFGGSVDALFNQSDVLHNLVYIDISHNLVTGGLPSQWINYSVPNLQTLLLSTNCFTGTISSSFSNIPILQNLILDAYGSAQGCDVQVPYWLRWLIKGLFVKHVSSAGTIPEDIVRMKSLQTLHAAGNALTGQLPDLPEDSNLLDISLSNNYLQGTIPMSWQTRGRFVQLDLSANKLSGVLSSNLSVIPTVNISIDLNGTSMGTVFDLSVNRISGIIPSALYSAEGVNVLNGNLFQCQESNMPKHDLSSKTYVCGSGDLNLTLFAWLAVIACAVGLYLALKSKLQQTEGLLKDITDANIFVYTLKRISEVIVVLSGFSVVILLTAYLAMKSDSASTYSTHAYQYGWVTTISYLHDILPSCLILIFIMIASVVVRYQVHRVVSDSPVSNKEDPWEYIMVAKLIGVLMCHMTVTIAVNIAYVFAILIGLPTSQLTALQFAVAVFKLIWNRVYVNWSLLQLPFLSDSGRLQLTSAMKIFTFLISPYVGTFLSDSTCFRYVITGTPLVSASFLSQKIICQIFCFEGTCKLECGFENQAVVSTSTAPPWLYSYQCSSALLTNYVPVLVASYLVSGVFVPAAVTLYGLLSENYIEKWLPEKVKSSNLSNSIYAWRSSDSIRCSETQIGPSLPLPMQSKPLFETHQVISKLVMNVAVLLTFGFAAPLLGVIIAVDSCAIVFVWKRLIYRFMVLHLLPNGLISSEAISRLDSTTSNCREGLHRCWLVSIISVTFFWGLFIFDMVGDVYGPKIGGLTVICPSLGLMVVVLSPIAITTVADKKKAADIDGDNLEIEMGPMRPMNSPFSEK